MPLKRLAVGFLLLIFLTGCLPPPGAVSAAQAVGPAATLSSVEPTPFLTALPTLIASAPTLPVATLRPTTTSSAPTPTSSVLGVLGFPVDVNPLTGLKVADPQILNRRPVLIKVANWPASGRPHAGLSFADIVFEYYIGEFTNRFMAVFYGQDSPKIGPVRSGRLVDSQLTNMYGGILGYGNADSKVDDVLVRELGDRAISFNDAPCPPMCGKDTHDINGVFANSAEMTRFAINHQINNDRPDLRGMLFDSKVPTSSQLAVKIGVQYIYWNRGEWRYDPQSGKYLRWIDDGEIIKPANLIPLVDRITGEQLAFDNVMIVFANYIEYAPTLHDIDITINTTGERAVLFRDGVMVEGKWRSIGPDHPIQFLDRWGIPLPLKPGNTWVVITGNSSKFEQVDPGQWELHFDLP